MPGTYLDIVGGRTTQQSAISTSSGAPDANKLPKLDSNGRIDSSMMPVGIGADTKAITTSEALSAGNIVNIWDSTGAKSRKADATAAGKEGVGFVLASVASGASATVYFEGTITGLTGLVPGTRYYLSAATPGTITNTPPSASGNVVQYIGTALSVTELSFEPEDGIILA